MILLIAMSFGGGSLEGGSLEGGLQQAGMVTINGDDNTALTPYVEVTVTVQRRRMVIKTPQ